MAHNLRNFRLDDEDWKAFLEACKTEKTSASAELSAFVKAYLGGFRLDKGEINTSLSDRLSSIENELAELRGKSIAPSVSQPPPINQPIDLSTARPSLLELNRLHQAQNTPARMPVKPL